MIRSDRYPGEAVFPADVYSRAFRLQESFADLLPPLAPELNNHGLRRGLHVYQVQQDVVALLACDSPEAPRTNPDPRRFAATVASRYRFGEQVLPWPVPVSEDLQLLDLSGKMVPSLRLVAPTMNRPPLAAADGFDPPEPCGAKVFEFL